MKNLTVLKSTWNETKAKGDILLLREKQMGLSVSSPVSQIISRLISESKQGEMLSRLQSGLGRTKEEVYMLISEL